MMGNITRLRKISKVLPFLVLARNAVVSSSGRKPAAEAAWAVAREMLQNSGFGLVVLDELNIALKYQYLDVDRVVADLRARPPMQHVVVTGRGAPPALVEAADTVTDMTPVKHAFAAGVKAMPGMEW